MAMDDPQSARSDKPWATARRRAGCLLGCLTEPFVMVGLMLGAVVGAYLWGRKSERNVQAHRQEPPAPEPPEEAHD